MFQAEETAKRKKIRRWANFVEEVVAATDAEEEDAKENDAERKVHYEKVGSSRINIVCPRSLVRFSCE